MDLSLPSNVKLEKERDSLGGRILETNVYTGKIEVAYLDYAESGAMSINIHFRTNNNQTVKQTTYISNKKGEFTYPDKNNNNEPKALPGYTEMVSFFQAVTGKSIADQETEDKMVKVYSSEAKKEVPKKVKVFIEATGAMIGIGILKISEEKTAKNNSGVYVGTGEFRDVNKFDKYFDGSNGLTNVEKEAGETEPAFLLKWKEAKVGKAIVKKAKVSGVPEGATAGAPGQTSDSKPKLFS